MLPQYQGGAIWQKENALDDTTKQLHEIVEKVRYHAKMGAGYMSLAYEIEWEKQEARKEGLELGRSEGRELGLTQGRTEGLTIGREEQRSEDITAAILTLSDFNIPKELIIAQLLKRFRLTEENAQKYVEQLYPNS